MSTNSQHSQRQFVHAMQVEHNGRNQRHSASTANDGPHTDSCGSVISQASCDSKTHCTFSDKKCRESKVGFCPGEDPKTCDPQCHQVDNCIQDGNECGGCTWCEDQCANFNCPANKHIEPSAGAAYHHHGKGECRCCRHSCNKYACPTGHQAKSQKDCSNGGEDSCFCESWHCDAASDTATCCNEIPKLAPITPSPSTASANCVWGEWGDCSSTCDGGNQHRKKTTKETGSGTCTGAASQTCNAGITCAAGPVCTCANGRAATAGAVHRGTANNGTSGSACTANGPKCVSCDATFTLNTESHSCVAASTPSPSPGSTQTETDTVASTQTETVKQASSSSSLTDSKKLMRSAGKK